MKQLYDYDWDRCPECGKMSLPRWEKEETVTERECLNIGCNYLESKCAHGNIHAGSLHPCPLLEDVHNNPKPHCNCCEQCMNDCRDEI